MWVSVSGASCLLCSEVGFCTCAVSLLPYRSIRGEILSISLTSGAGLWLLHTTELVHVGNLPDTQEEKVGRDTVRKLKCHPQVSPSRSPVVGAETS